MNKKRDCIFCNRKKIKDDILWESEHFFVKVGVGIFAPGHIMLITKKHLSCFGKLPDELNEEFLSAKDYIFNKVKSNFSEPIIYEHGIYGQSINHAHIHFVPKKSNLYLLNSISEKIFNGLKAMKVDTILDIKGVFKRDGSYIYLEGDKKKQIFLTKNALEGKFAFREEFVRLTGINELLDWRTMSTEFKKKNEEWAKLTKNKLTNF